MKRSIPILAILALSGSVALAEGPGKGDRKRPDGRKIIEHLDKDGNGTVSKQEFTSGERAQKNPEMAEKMFAKIDADSNGEISAEEFAKHRPKEGRKRPKPGEIMKRLDKDGNGSISKAEFTSGERAQRNPEMAAKMFDKLDANGDGEISREEFAKRPKRGPRGGGDGPGRPEDADGPPIIE